MYVFYGLSPMNSDLSVFQPVHTKVKKANIVRTETAQIPTLFAEAAKLAKKVEHSLQLQQVIWENTQHLM